MRHERVMGEEAQPAMPSSRTVAPLELMHRPANDQCGKSVGDELQVMSYRRCRLPLSRWCFHDLLSLLGLVAILVFGRRDQHPRVVSIDNALSFPPLPPVFGIVEVDPLGFV